MKYLKATWIASDPGGHVSITGLEEFLDEMVRKPGGGRVHRKGSVGEGIVVTPAEDDEQIHERTKTKLLAGEFMVQETPKNLETLEDYVKLGFVHMDDWDLHHRLLGEEPVQEEIVEKVVEKPVVTETDVSPKHSPAAVRARKQETTRKLQEANEEARKEDKEAIEALSVITSVKIRKPEILQGLVEKGIKDVGKLAETDKDILLSIKFVGDKLADNMLEEAQKLSGGSQEE